MDQSLNSIANPYVIRTSGSTGVAKEVVHTRDSLHAAADMAVEAFGLNSTDRFLQTLPHEHVSGLMLHVRAQVCGGELVPYSGQGRWNAQDCLEVLRREEITRCSLVPAQLFDWVVTLGARAPRSLATVWLGGDHLRGDLKQRALALGWPVVETYGMTETAGMIAVRNEGVGFSCLPGVEVREVGGRLAIRAPQLFTGYLRDGKVVNAVGRDGFWATEDECAFLPNSDFQILGRAAQKIGGEKVLLNRLREKWEALSGALTVRTELVLVSDERLGAVVVLRTESAAAVQMTVDAFNQSVAPFEKIRRVEKVDVVGLEKVTRAPWP